jgi:transposase
VIVKRSIATSNKSNATVATMGIDIGKNSFHVVGLDQRGAIVLRQKWTQPSRSAARRNATVPDRHGGLCRRPSPEPQALGHDARLMPAKYVRAFNKGSS